MFFSFLNHLFCICLNPFVLGFLLGIRLMESATDKPGIDIRNSSSAAWRWWSLSLPPSPQCLPKNSIALSSQYICSVVPRIVLGKINKYGMHASLSVKLTFFKPIFALMGFTASLSSPCNFQQGPLTNLMCNICSCLICLSQAMFVFSLSCRKVDCEGGSACLQWIYFFPNYTNYCRFHLVGALLCAPPWQG